MMETLGLPQADDPFMWPDEGVSRVPYRVYNDPEIYRAEQE